MSVPENAPPASSGAPARGGQGGRSEAQLLDPSLLHRIEHLRFATRRRLASGYAGARRSRHHGASIEFSDYRDYAPGDDPRTIDWRAYGRLDKLFVKLFNAEDDLSLHLLIDTSRSMAFGTPSKLMFARQLAAALGAVALTGLDRCSLTTLAAADRGIASVTVRGRGSLASLLSEIGRAPESGSVEIARSLSRYVQARSAPGIIVVASDFYDHHLTSAILAQVSVRHEIVLAHIVAPEEIDPEAAGMVDAGGDFRLVDSESGSEIELTITPDALEQYRANFAAFCDGLSQSARAAGAVYLRVPTDSSLSDTLTTTLRQTGILR
jgi:uncharacterized protein (DUF58 family)